MGWKLFLDDFRVPRLVHVDPKDVVVCRTAMKALAEVAARGFPEMMYLDFDLGFEDGGLSGLDFLKQLYASWSPTTPIPACIVISDHPDRHLMSNLMDQWKQSHTPSDRSTMPSPLL